MSTATKPASDCTAPEPCTCVGCAQAVIDRESALDLGGSWVKGRGGIYVWTAVEVES